MGIVQQAYAARRELPTALAHVYMTTKPRTERNEALGRIFATMTPASQLVCRAEMLRCHEAKRSTRLAEIAA